MIGKYLQAALALAALFCAPCLHAVEASAATPSILSKVKSTGVLVCGVIREEEDYSKSDMHGNRALFDADLCRSVAIAVNGPKAKVLFSTFPDEPSANKGLLAGKVQIIASATPSVTNSILLGVRFSPVVFFDGEALLVRKSSGISAPKDLEGKKVCFIDQTNIADHLPTYAQRTNIKWQPFPFEEEGEMEAAMYTATCAAMASDVTQLATARARFNVRGKDMEILPQWIAIDPLAIAYAAGDPEWAAVVDATVSVLIQAEESGVTSQNAEQQQNTTDVALEPFFSSGSSLPALLHLEPGWAAGVIKAVGNYGEMYERDLGSKSPLQIPRGPNNLWDHGGMMYAPPMGGK